MNSFIVHRQWRGRKKHAKPKLLRLEAARRGRIINVKARRDLTRYRLVGEGYSPNHLPYSRLGLLPWQGKFGTWQIYIRSTPYVCHTCQWFWMATWQVTDRIYTYSPMEWSERIKGRAGKVGLDSRMMPWYGISQQWRLKSLTAARNDPKIFSSRYGYYGVIAPNWPPLLSSSIYGTVP